MTFCAGWKSDTAVFLIADMAVTRPIKKEQKRNDSSQVTVTGKRHISNKHVVVRDEAVKVFRVKDIFFTFAGDVPVGINILNQLDRFLNDLNLSPSEAMKYIVKPKNMGGSANCIFGFMDGGTPQLWEFKTNGHEYPIEGYSVVFGTMDPKFSDNFLIFVSNSCREPNEKQFVSLLTRAVTYQNRANLMLLGIGGAMHGAYVDAEGFHYPLIHFFFWEEKHEFFVQLKNKLLYISSTYSGNSIHVPNNINRKQARKLIREDKKKFFNRIKKSQVDYFVVIKNNGNAVIFERQNKAQANDLCLEEQDGKLHLALSKVAYDAIDKPFGDISYIRYQPVELPNDEEWYCNLYPYTDRDITLAQLSNDLERTPEGILNAFQHFDPSITMSTVITGSFISKYLRYIEAFYKVSEGKSRAPTDAVMKEFYKQSEDV